MLDEFLHRETELKLWFSASNPHKASGNIQKPRAQNDGHIDLVSDGAHSVELGHREFGDVLRFGAAEVVVVAAAARNEASNELEKILRLKARSVLDDHGVEPAVIFVITRLHCAFGILQKDGLAELMDARGAQEISADFRPRSAHVSNSEIKNSKTHLRFSRGHS